MTVAVVVTACLMAYALAGAATAALYLAWSTSELGDDDVSATLLGVFWPMTAVVSLAYWWIKLCYRLCRFLTTGKTDRPVRARVAK